MTVMSPYRVKPISKVRIEVMPWTLSAGISLLPDCHCKMTHMSQDLTRETKVTRKAPTVLAIAFAFTLLLPTLLCALPLYAMSSSEHECCLHMKMQECSQANMSSCCTTGSPSIAMDLTTVAKMLTPISSTSQPYVVTSATVATSSASNPTAVNLHSSSPPLLNSVSSVQVLRI